MPLVAEGVSPKLYITHTVQPKENFYSLGRMYNISPKEIAPFNNLQLDKGLNLNEIIKVPLTPAILYKQVLPPQMKHWFQYTMP